MRLVVFDFDWTLFRSPGKPAYWRGPWWPEPLSIGPPCVPEVPGSEWWNQDVVEAARSAIRDVDAYTLLMTGREAEIFARRVFDLLDQVKLRFDEAYLTPMSANDTGRFKMGRILAAVDRIEPERIDIYDDYEELLDWYVDELERRGYWTVPHLIPIDPQIVICEEP